MIHFIDKDSNSDKFTHKIFIKYSKTDTQPASGKSCGGFGGWELGVYHQGSCIGPRQDRLVLFMFVH